MSRKLTDTARRLLAEETGTIYKTHGARLNVALAFPNTYFLGMSNLGFQCVYRLFNEMSAVRCERVFLPEPAEAEEYRHTRTPLFTLESQARVRDMDVLAFSISYELDYSNVLHILELSGIPLRSVERGDNDPIILVGGPVTILNPEPLADFVDAMVVGEAEEVLEPIADVLAEFRGDRMRTLVELAKIPGVYVPEFYEVEYHPDGTVKGFSTTHETTLPVPRQWVRTLEPYNITSVITTPNTEFANFKLTEIMRGCGRHCRFCVVGYAFLPPRFKSGDTVRSAFEEVGSAQKLGLVGASVYDHPDCEPMTTEIVDKGIAYNVSSLRADTITDVLAENMVRGGQKSITVAAEAGSDRLRKFINKDITEDQVRDAVEKAMRAGVKRIKLYFMVGLPTEEMDDVEGIPLMAEKLNKEFHPERISLSVSCHIPKPGAPFMWAAQDSLPLLEKKVDHVRGRLRRYGNVKVLGESPRVAMFEATMARGDRRASALVEEFYRERVFSKSIYKRSGIDPAFYATRPREIEEVFPWDLIDLGFPKSYLWKEWQRALKMSFDPPCDVSSCSRCGICPSVRDEIDTRQWVGLKDYLAERGSKRGLAPLSVR